ncbi:MAG: hypothetical protein M3409_06205 [Gemmatimonadota bacterium]|jgi:hypothetical protein|nr:hypothetical protein [Gemmatimonadota bacterium]
MSSDSTRHEDQVVSFAWTGGCAGGAGIYLLGGRCHVAAHHSPTASRLVESGALLIANLRFDRDPLEGSHPERPVHPIESREAVQRFRYTTARN